jgi:hypothetical protein
MANGSTLSELIVMVRDLLNEELARFWTDAQITRYINDGQRDIAAKSLCIENVDALTIGSTVTTGWGTFTWGSAPWGAGTQAQWDGHKLEAIEYNAKAFLGLAPGQLGHKLTNSNAPGYWIPIGASVPPGQKGVLVFPSPTTAYALLAYIADYPSAEIAAGVNPEIRAAFVWLIVLYATSKCLEEEGKQDPARVLLSIYENELAELTFTLIEQRPEGRDIVTLNKEGVLEI